MPYRYIRQKMVMIPAGLCLLMGIAVLPAFPTHVVTPETPVPAARAATRLSGRVIAIQDGDTLTLLDASGYGPAKLADSPCRNRCA